MIGYIMIAAFFLFMFGITAYVLGLRETFFAFFVAALFSAWIMIAKNLVERGI